MERSAEFWIEQLQMLPHPEGGFYKEIYRADLTISQDVLPAAFKGNRPASTSIYFLLRQEEFSAFHRIASDEIWHFYAGGPLEILEIDTAGNLNRHLLGNDPLAAQAFQVVIKGGNWFASRPLPGTAFSLAGCGVSPGFDFEDFEMASFERLRTDYPQHESLIRGLTRD